MSGGSIGQGLFGGFGQPGAPGFVPGTVSAPVNQAAAGGVSAMANRYSQLGLGSQGASPGATGTPASPGGGLGQSTAALMDYGVLPSYTGGIAGEGNAVLGQLQNQTLQSPTGKNTSPASLLGTIGRII